MLLVEHDGKKLLTQLGVTIPVGQLVSLNNSSLPIVGGAGPWFLKAQILQGQRGKRGFVRRVDRPEAFNHTLEELRTAIGTEPCAGILIEEGVSFKEEWFIACDLNRETGETRLLISSQGGGNVSSLTPATDLGSVPSAIRDICTILQEQLSPLDALKIEINPLAVREDGSVIALDAKIELDSAASFRHPEWKELTPLSRLGRIRSEREQVYADYNTSMNPSGTLGRYVELDGDIAMLLAGGGASLVAMDALCLVGGKPANYLELSGNPDPVYVRGGVEIALTHPNLKAIWIAGSFANFTDIQSTVHAMLEAIEASGLRIPVVIRRDGPNADQAEQEALAWAKEKNIPLLFHRGTIEIETSAAELMKLIATV